MGVEDILKFFITIEFILGKFHFNRVWKWIQVLAQWFIMLVMIKKGIKLLIWKLRDDSDEILIKIRS